MASKRNHVMLHPQVPELEHNIIEANIGVDFENEEHMDIVGVEPQENAHEEALHESGVSFFLQVFSMFCCILFFIIQYATQYTY
jgi:hypothetical protein